MGRRLILIIAGVMLVWSVTQWHRNEAPAVDVAWPGLTETPRSTDRPSPVDRTHSAQPKPVAAQQPDIGEPLFTQTMPDKSKLGLLRRVQVYRAAFKYPFIRLVTEVMKSANGGESVTRELRMVADHLMVKVKPGVDRAALAAHVAPQGATIRRQVGKRPVYLVALRDARPETYDAALTRWAGGDAVIEYAEPDHIAQIGSVPVIPNDTDFSNQWNMHNTGGGGRTVDADIDAPEAWAITTGSTSVVLAVIDSGIDLTHPDLLGNLWTNPGESGDGKETDGIDNDGNGYVDDVHGWNFSAGTNSPGDDHGHGSHVAGTMGAVGGNGSGIAGVCHSVRLMALKFLDITGSGTDSDAIEAIAYATDNGAFATNNSWGGSDFTQTMQDVIAEANAAGVGFIAAAGNDGTNNDVIPNYPCNYPVPNVISVAATDYTDTMSWFSCYGAQTVHLGAPGFQTFSTIKDGSYGLMSGTSMAAPHVAGACGLLKAANPALTFAEIKAMLLAQVDPLPSMTAKSITGGRLNLAKALTPATGPLLRVASLQVDDSAANNDGVASPGETIQLLVSVINAGAMEANDVTGVLALQSVDPEVTITQNTADYGDLSFNAISNAAATPFVISISSAKTTVDVPMVLTLTSGSFTWTEDVVLQVRTVATLSGTVTAVSGGLPIENVNIEITGAETHTLQTNALGEYAVSLTNGHYTVQATKSGLVASEPQAVTISTSPQTVDFVLGASDSTVTPSSLAMTLQEGQTGTQTLTITNHGDVPMPYEIRQVPPPSPPGSGTLQLATSAPAAVDAALVRPPEGLVLPAKRDTRFRDASMDAVATLPWHDGFEDGLWGRWWPANCEAVREVVSDTAAEGLRSFHLRPTEENDGHLTGLEQWFSYNPKPGYVSFWVRPGQRDSATSYMVLGDVYWTFTGSGFSLALADFIWFFANANGRFYLNDDVGGNQLVAYAEGTWYKVEFRDMNWTSRTFDYWVNGTLVQADVPFRNPTLASGMAVAFAYNYFTNTDAWWDEVKFFDDALPWIDLSTSRGTLAPGASVDVTVTFDSDSMKPGLHEGSLLVKTNDPITPQHSVSLAMTVTDGPNQPPVATAQSLTLGPNEARAITLAGTDPDNDLLSYFIVELPHKGALYQTADGTTLGAKITTTPKRVSDAQRRVIYIPESGEHGSPYTSFEFVVRDAEDESAKAEVELSVSSGPLLFVSPAGASSAGPVNVHLSSSDPSAQITFTTNNTHPSPTSAGYFGSGILHLDRSVTLRVIAFGANGQSEEQTHVFTITDSDLDGLPDWWETSEGAAHTAQSAADDPDGNGLTAMDEFIAGVAPGESAGFLSRLSVGSNHTVTWFGALGRRYFVESSPDAKTWTTFGSGYFGSGTEMNFSIPASSGEQFYRVRAELP